MQKLSSGIAHALVTTAGGLAVAIPALVLSLYFVSRADYLIMRIDALADEFVALVCAERSVPLSARRVRGDRPDKGERPDRGERKTGTSTGTDKLASQARPARPDRPKDGSKAA